ncbi:MAG: molybdenum cofactor synthesis domain-containing protein [Bacteroidales bacterium]|jgi:molybdenum cofactor synthesis domain-containing protein|nr:molybdenum cofactor synthesis domain-containing protein [Bacteroidales bacterium]
MSIDSKHIKILSVNTSEKKGTVKKPVSEIHLNERGVEGDAHSGNWHRQVSMLAKESVDKFAELAGRKIECGEFAENITTEGMLLYEASPLDRFFGEQLELEVTQIGKKCHGDSCAIFREVGNCVMPKEGIFCRVLKLGDLQAGDTLEYIPKVYSALVITLSDRAYAGEYEDRSGPRLKEHLGEFFRARKWLHEIDNVVIPDDEQALSALLLDAVEQGVDFIFTTGGTGIGPRDISPDIMRSVMQKEIPGIMEMIRMKYGMEKPNALLSRGVAGVADKTLLFALPGSVKAVNEYMEEITKSLKHMVYMLHGLDTH